MLCKVDVCDGGAYDAYVKNEAGLEAAKILSLKRYCSHLKAEMIKQYLLFTVSVYGHFCLLFSSTYVSEG